MKETVYPILDENGTLFCMAQRTADGKDIRLIGKNGAMTLHQLEMKAIMPEACMPRSKRKNHRELKQNNEQFAV